MQLDKPIIIEAKSRKEADAILINLNQKTLIIFLFSQRN